MKTWKTAFATLAALAVLGLAAGCGDSPAPGAAERSGTATPADPRAAFLASYRALEAGHYAYSVEADGDRTTGIIHAPGRTASTHTEGDVGGNRFTTDTIFAGGTAYLRMDLGAEGNERLGIDAGTWYELDTAVATKLDYTFEELSPVQPNFAASITAVARSGDRGFAGTFDFSVAARGNPNPRTGTLVTNLGEAARSIAFTAETDGQNRISKLVWVFPKTERTPALTQTISFGDYGTATAPTAPSARPAPAAVNQLYA